MPIIFKAFQRYNTGCQSEFGLFPQCLPHLIIFIRQQYISSYKMYNFEEFNYDGSITLKLVILSEFHYLFFVNNLFVMIPSLIPPADHQLHGRTCCWHWIIWSCFPGKDEQSPRWQLFLLSFLCCQVSHCFPPLDDISLLPKT